MRLKGSSYEGRLQELVRTGFNTEDCFADVPTGKIQNYISCKKECRGIRNVIVQWDLMKFLDPYLGSFSNLSSSFYSNMYASLMLLFGRAYPIVWLYRQLASNSLAVRLFYCSCPL